MEPYFVEFYVRRVAGTTPGLIGAYFDRVVLDIVAGKTPQVSATVTDASDYVQVSGLFTPAIASEYYTLYIGAFNTGSFSDANYFFLDDVTVTPCSDFGDFTQQPTNQSLVVGEDAQFSVTATGSGITGYQWQRLYPTAVDLHDTDEAGEAYVGTNTPTLTIKAADHLDVGNYRCMLLYEPCGIRASQLVELTCDGVPQIVQEPVDVLALLGESVTFSFEVPPFFPPGGAQTYHWYNDTTHMGLADGGAHSGTKTRTLTINPTVAAHAGYYRCQIENICGTTFTRRARLQFVKGWNDDRRPTVTSHREDLPAAIEHATLVQNSPNPFNPRTTIPFAVPNDTHATLTVYDSSGHLVRRLVNGQVRGGAWQFATWDGRSDAGEVLASGIYFYRLDAQGEVVTRKMVLLK